MIVLPYIKCKDKTFFTTCILFIEKITIINKYIHKIKKVFLFFLVVLD